MPATSCSLKWVLSGTPAETRAAGASPWPLQRWCRPRSWACRRRTTRRCVGVWLEGSRRAGPASQRPAPLAWQRLKWPLHCLSPPFSQAAQWYPVGQLPKLAFDHRLIVRTALAHLAQQQAVQQRPGLAAALAAAADTLQGPWQEQ